MQVEPTNRCNLDCEICIRRFSKRPLGDMKVEDFQRIIDVNRPLYVAFHGWGEPLLNDKIYEMITYASKKRAKTSLITNGTLLNEGSAKILLNLKLNELAFGVYKLERLKEIKDKVKLVSSLKQKFKLKEPKIFLDITIYERNESEILQIIEESSRLGVEAINVHRIFHLYNSEFKPLSTHREKQLFQKINALTKNYRMKLILPKKHSYPCRIAKNCIFVTWDAMLTPCCFMPDSCLADALKVSIKEVVKSREYKEFIRNMNSHPVCSRCVI